MENFRAKQFENLNFEGEVFSGGPCGCDYCMGECEDCEEIIDSLKKERDRYFKTMKDKDKCYRELNDKYNFVLGFIVGVVISIILFSIF